MQTPRKKKKKKKVLKQWDPLRDALIPELFEFPRSDQSFYSYERTNTFSVTDTTTLYIEMMYSFCLIEAAASLLD
jgi:hypothetical protein